MSIVEEIIEQSGSDAVEAAEIALQRAYERSRRAAPGYKREALRRLQVRRNELLRARLAVRHG